MRAASIAFGLSVLMLLSGCSTPGSISPNAPAVQAGPTPGSRRGSTRDLAVAGLKLLFEAANAGLGSSHDAPRVYGLCEVESYDKRGRAVKTESCQHTFVMFESLKPVAGRQVRVWVDNRGYFEFVFEKGEQWSVTAYDEKRKRQSNSLIVDRGGKVWVSIR